MLPGTILWLPQRLRRMPRPTAGQPRSRSARKARRRRRKSGSAQAHACPNPAAARTLLRRRQQTLVHFALTGRTCSGVYRAALRSTTRPRGRKAPSGWRRYAHPPSASQSGLHAAPLGTLPPRSSALSVAARLLAEAWALHRSVAGRSAPTDRPRRRCPRRRRARASSSCQRVMQRRGAVHCQAECWDSPLDPLSTRSAD
mmetsp:Transcript_21735/g.47539  ORF Transcript_21735/g.47539 Transcript_21735/m.47539 type:complete len:200 (-) Transcript_21735:13-612(-)